MNTMSWNAGPLIAFDTETTGTAPTSDRIVSAAIVDDSGATTWLIDPGTEIPTAASAVHGITTQHAREHGREPRQALAEIGEALTNAADKEIPVVVYRAGFDLTLLACELGRHELPQAPWEALRVVDPYVLDKKCDRYRRGKRTLSDVCAHYGVELSEAHSAAADARAALSLARAVAEADSRISGMNAAELHLAQAGWHADDAESLEAFFRRKGRDEVVDRRWPLQR
ncbi:MAG: exonuclease domain-containing protein [Stackebrandtia sp.]